MRPFYEGNRRARASRNDVRAALALARLHRAIRELPAITAEERRTLIEAANVDGGGAGSAEVAAIKAAAMLRVLRA